MKKKTAITLGVLALLAAGVTFGGFKIKEKNKIEKALNDMLIDDAEHEWKKLSDNDFELRDSVAYYADMIQGLTPGVLVSKTDADKLRQLVSDIYNDWSIAYTQFMDKYWDVGYEGDRSFDVNRLPKAAQKQYKHLNGGMLKKYSEIDAWEKHLYDEELHIGVDFDHVYVDDALKRIQNTLAEIEQDTIMVQENSLKRLETFVDNIDNSQGVIKQKTLLKLKNVVKDLLHRGNVKQRENLTQKKAAFERAQDSVHHKSLKSRKKLELLRLREERI